MKHVKVFLWKMNESEPFDEVSKITQQGEHKFKNEYSWIGVVDNQCLGGIERSIFVMREIRLTLTLAGDQLGNRYLGGMSHRRAYLRNRGSYPFMLRERL